MITQSAFVNYDTKIGLLVHWGMHKGLFSTVDVDRYGLENHYTSATKRMRDLARKGIFRRIPDPEAKNRGLIKGQIIAWYENPNVKVEPGGQICLAI